MSTFYMYAAFVISNLTNLLILLSLYETHNAFNFTRLSFYFLVPLPSGLYFETDMVHAQILKEF